VRYPDIHFSGSDQNEQYLNYFDSKGMKMILQVEPGQADVSTLIRLVLDKYGHHPCVTGFGVDVEWLQFNGNPAGRQVTDQEASRYRRKLPGRPITCPSLRQEAKKNQILASWRSHE